MARDTFDFDSSYEYEQNTPKTTVDNSKTQEKSSQFKCEVVKLGNQPKVHDLQQETKQETDQNQETIKEILGDKTMNQPTSTINAILSLDESMEKFFEYHKKVQATLKKYLLTALVSAGLMTQAQANDSFSKYYNPPIEQFVKSCDYDKSGGINSNPEITCFEKLEQQYDKNFVTTHPPLPQKP